jgi:hypothetical protein
LREELLAQSEPSREKFVQYQQEVQAMLAQNERRLRLEWWYSGAIWIYAVLFMTACLLLVGYRGLLAPAASVLALAFVLLICAGVEVVKHFINRSRVELLKELKGLELQVRQLEERFSDAREKA